MVEPNKDLEQIFENAVHVAGINNHEYITLEHFLYSMLNNETFSTLLTSFGVDLKTFKEDLENYIEKDLTVIVNPEVEKPKKTEILERMLNRAFTQVIFSRRNVIEPADCFISMFSEKSSHANFFINKANIDKDKFVTFLNKEAAREEVESESKELQNVKLQT